jgi:hypothetical protein
MSCGGDLIAMFVGRSETQCFGIQFSAVDGSGEAIQAIDILGPGLAGHAFEEVVQKGARPSVSGSWI